MAIYSRLKKVVKKINETYIGHLLLLVPLVIYFWSKQIRSKFSDLFYAYFYYYSSRLHRNNDLTIGIKKLGEKKTRFPHPVGVVVGRYVEIGYNCTIYQNVTIGAKTETEANMQLYPRIGNNVVIGANSVIIGNITIGNNVFIGASTFINKDIPDNAIVYGIPLQINFKEDR